MLALRLVHLIESHSEQLSARLLHTFQTSEKCSDLRKVPPDELRERTREICRNISEWLTAKTEKDIERRYTELGARRTAQGVHLSHFIWALGATREHIHDFLRSQGLVDNTVELVGMMELMGRLDRFFDLAVYYACVGYENAKPAKERTGTMGIVASF